jgi:uncharacterized alpha-E superfamily protein
MSRKQSRKAELTNLWRSTKSAAEFINSIYERKFVLLRCDCCKFWVVDQHHVHSLETSLDGAREAAKKAAEAAAPAVVKPKHAPAPPTKPPEPLRDRVRAGLLRRY